MPTVMSVANGAYAMYEMTDGSTAAAKKAAAENNAASAATEDTASKETSKADAKETSRKGDSESEKQQMLAEAQAKVASIRNLVNSFSNAYGTGSRTASASSTSELWASYASSAASLTSLRSVTSGAAALTESYEETKNTFTTQYGAAMRDLRETSREVAATKFAFGASDVTTTEDGVTVYSDGVKQAVKSVQNLISDYNDALGITSEYAGLGQRMEALGSTFSDTTYRADAYRSVGISVDAKTGKLTVDEDKLAQAMTTDGSHVEAVLGKNGLAGKAEDHADFAISQQDKMFPALKTMFGSQLDQANAYRSRGVLNGTMQAELIGNMLDSMF